MNFVLPALQTTLSSGAAAMGQTLKSLINQAGDIGNPRAQVGIALAVIAQNMAGGGSAASGAAAAAGAPGSTRR